MNIKELAHKRMTKKVSFMGDKVEISKLSVAQVQEIQDHAKGGVEDEQAGFALLKTVISMSVEGGADLTDADFNSFPMDELSSLSQEIMSFSGMGGAAAK
jgi:hypothetical protein